MEQEGEEEMKLWKCVGCYYPCYFSLPHDVKPFECPIDCGEEPDWQPCDYLKVVKVEPEKSCEGCGYDKPHCPYCERGMDWPDAPYYKDGEQMLKCPHCKKSYICKCVVTALFYTKEDK